MQTPRSDTTAAVMAQVEQRLAEMQRRTMSTLTVSNLNGAMLDVGDGHVIFRHPADGTVLLANDPTQWGYDAPLAATTVFSSAPFSSSSDVANISNYNVYARARLYPQSPRIRISTRTYRVVTNPSVVCEFRCVYRLNGGSDTVIAESQGATTATSATEHNWEFIWPASNYFGALIELDFQARLQGAVVGGDALFHSPSRIYGGAM